MDYGRNWLIRRKEEKYNKEDIPGNRKKVQRRTKHSEVEGTFDRFQVSTTVNEVEENWETVRKVHANRSQCDECRECRGVSDINENK
jgi:hypothetical protein